MKESGVNQILQLIVVLLFIWLINQLAERSGIQIDLTEEKRYTLSPATEQLLADLNQDIFFEVYLAGELQPNFERFQKSIFEMLDQFGQLSSNQVKFKFTDPAQAKSTRLRNEYFQSLMQKGLQPTNLSYSKDGDRLQKLIFPSALVSSGMIELPVNLLKGNRAAGPEQILNQSIEGLEYELASVISQLVDGGIKKIGLVKGHGSPEADQLAGLKNAILSKYNLYDIQLKGKERLTGYDAIIVAKPREQFSEQEKYLMDQYLMKGGNLLFFIDALSVDIDSALGEGTVAIPYETNLDDMLFKYGVRVNRNFVLDLNSGELPIVGGNFGDQPQIQMLPWPFFPLVTNFSKHPSVRNLDAVLTRFTSSIDTVKATGIRKTPLASTTQYSKVLGPPVVVAFNDLQDKLHPDRFNDGVKAIAYLLEGKFTSLYANRLVPKGFDQSDFLGKGQPGKVIVVGDGDLIINDFDPESGEPLGLGVEGYSKNTYANEQFVLNLINYLVDDTGLIATRSRELKVRPLDKVKVSEQRTLIQVINIGLPLCLIFAFGIIKWIVRKRRYTSGNE